VNAAFAIEVSELVSKDNAERFAITLIVRPTADRTYQFDRRLPQRGVFEEQARRSWHVDWHLAAIEIEVCGATESAGLLPFAKLATRRHEGEPTLDIP
jgi:hypothetical protein